MSAPDDNPPSWKEPASLFVIMLLSIAALSTAAAVVPLIGDWLLLLAALVFIGLPFLWLSYRGEDLHRFGIDLESIPLRHVGLGLLVTIVVFPLFALGNHLWETQTQDRQLHFHADHLRHWSSDLEAPPRINTLSPGLQIRAQNQHLYLHWTPPPSAEPIVVDAQFDRPWRWETSPSLQVTPQANGDDRLARDWTLHLPANSPAQASLPLPHDIGDVGTPPRQLSLQISGATDEIPILIGDRAVDPEDESLLQWTRNHWWLLLWGLTHLLLIALPEEYFYRGYLQTRLGDLLHGPQSDPESPPTLLGFSFANWITSICFALGHFLIPVGGAFNPARAAVFFPSLIFGRLKRHTQSIIAPTVFHAGANMMVLLLAPHYF